MSCAQILQQARQMQRISQLELSLRMNVSQRHISFVENGRARPSRALIAQWIDAAGAPRPLLALALQAAGYATEPHRDDGAHASEMAAVLGTHSPFPVLVFDDDWLIRGQNDAGAWLASTLTPGCWGRAAASQGPLDMIDTGGARDGLLAAMTNGDEAAASLLGQLEVEALHRTGLRERVDEFADEVRSRYRIAPRGQLIERMRTSREFAFASRIGPLRFLTVQSRMGNAVAGSPLRLEHWLPADHATRQTMLKAALDFDF